MQVIHPRCAGLDVHQKTVVATIVLTREDGSVQKVQHTFLTMTPDLLALDDWLEQYQVTVVALESTGVYWRPVFNILEPARTIILVNARHMKAVPGRKTDVRDAQWIAELLQHGLLTGSFVPEQAQRELRELTRYRTSLVRERADEVNRLQKVLEGANIKLARVATDLLGVSGRAMLEALVAGSTERAAVADLARGKMRKKRPELEQALLGHFGLHQRFLVAQQLAPIDRLDATTRRPILESSRWSVALIGSLPAALRVGQTVFAETGGLHAAGLFDGQGRLGPVCEDVGRHNAVDKVIGAALLAGRLQEFPILVVSGRIAFEIVQKAALTGLTTVVAVGAPTDTAIAAARETGLTLVGFSREDRFNVYTGADRILEIPNGRERPSNQ